MTRRRVPPGLRSVVVVILDSTGARSTVPERMALSIRNSARATGQCLCGAVVEGVPAGLVPATYHEIETHHADDTPAISKAALRGAHRVGDGR